MSGNRNKGAKPVPVNKPAKAAKPAQVVDTPVVEVIEPVVVVEEKHDRFSMRIDIDQIGLDKNGALSSPLMFTLEAVKHNNVPLNLQQIAGQFAQLISGGIMGLPNIGSGYNVNFFIDNQLQKNVTMRGAGHLQFSNATKLAHGILNILGSIFDEENAEGLLTGEIRNSGEIELLCKQLGISEPLPMLFIRDVLKVRSIAIADKLRQSKKLAIQQVKDRYKKLPAPSAN
jgi:hypothetical protein